MLAAQMIRDSRILIVIGFVLVLAGVVLPMLMVLRIVESTFFLNFFSYSASISGLFLGLIGAASYVGRRKRAMEAARKVNEEGEPQAQ